MTTMTISARFFDNDDYEFGEGIVTIQYPGEKSEIHNFPNKHTKKDCCFDFEHFLQETLKIKQEEINKAEEKGYFAQANQIGLFFNGKLETLVMQKK